MPAIAIKNHVATGTTPDWFRRSRSYWKKVCQDLSFVTSSIKVAELGGSADTPFEQAFSNLAHAYLKDKAPQLMEYEIGFQLIEKNQENTKAVGVFGFKVGDQWLYAPVFFLNGDLKGHELLYLKSQDLFVPMKDNWLNYLLGRKPSMLGRSVGRDLSNLGVSPPSLHQLTRSPYKYASAAPPMADWFTDFLPDLGYLTTTNFCKSAAFDLEAVLLDMGRPAFDCMMKVAESYPGVFNAFESMHPDFLKKLAGAVGDKERLSKSDSIFRKAAATRQASLKSILGTEKKAEDEPSHIRVILREDVFGADHPDVMLSDDERGELALVGKIVKDDRPTSAISKVYPATTSLKLFNPDETNVYQVLLKPDKFAKCLVIMGPYGASGPQSHCTVIELDGHRFINIHPSRVFCQSRLSPEAWREWFDGLEDANSLPVTDGWKGKKQILINRTGQGTCPFTVDGKWSGEEGAYRVGYWSDHASYDDRRPYLTSDSRAGRSRWESDQDEHPDMKTIRLLKTVGRSLHATRDQLLVPASFKRLSLDSGHESGPGFGESDACCESTEENLKRPLEPGDLADIMFAIKTNLTPLDLVSTGDGLDVNGKRMSKTAAFKHLVVDWSLRADLADALIDSASASPLDRQKYLVKKADPFLTKGGPSSPAVFDQPMGADHMMGSNYPAMQMSEREYPVTDMRPNPGDREKYKPQGPDAQTMITAQQAAQTGQRELFDTAVLGSLLKTVRQSSMVDRYLGDLMKGMDRLGRIYFQFLWHGEEFEDRYGKQDLPELEDGMRNSFEAMGDITHKLKQKSVEPFAESGSDVDLGSIANS